MKIDFKSMEVKKSTEYFGLTDDELLENRNEYGYTREECKLFDDGLNVTFFDDMEELEEEAEQFGSWIESQRYEVKALVETVNGRIAVVIIQQLKQWIGEYYLVKNAQGNHDVNLFMTQEEIDSCGYLTE